MIKRAVHRIALLGEALGDLLFRRPGEGRQIDPYIGYATPDHIILRGRVLAVLRHATPGDDQSKWRNFRQILRMFMTDEVPCVTVCSGDVCAQTDEEGYFTLTLPRNAPSGCSSARITVDGGNSGVDCPVFVPRDDARFMVLSDIDDTVLHTGAQSLIRNLYTSFTNNSGTRLVYPDAQDLIHMLSQDGRNPVFYVSSSPWNLHHFLARVFENAGLVRGPVFLRDLGLSATKFITDGHGNHKGASIDRILRANPDLPAVLLGDTGQQDARIYRDVIARHGERVVAVGLRTPGRGMDRADHADIAALRAMQVLTVAGPDFVAFRDAVQAVLPTSRRAQPDQHPTAHTKEKERHTSVETTHLSGFDPATAALFLDFDGTLVDLAEQPDAIAVPPDLGGLLNTLRTRLNGRLALVTGRAIKDVRRYVPDFEGAIYASHGACLWVDARLTTLVGTPENLIELSNDARALCKYHPALRFEGKPTGFAVHFRQAPALAALVRSTLDEIVAQADGLQVQSAKMAFEVKAAGANKGAAVQDAITRFGWGDATPWMIGDDVTDEAAFEMVARLGGFGVKVGEGDTVARHHITAPADVMAFLRSL